MGKKLLSTAIVLYVLLSGVAASDIFSFTLVPSAPLMESYKADFWAATSRLQYGWFNSGAPTRIYAQRSEKDINGIKDYELRTFDFADPNENRPTIFMKPGVRFDLFRISSNLGFLPEQLSLEVSGKGFISTIFYAKGAKDQITMDGYFFIGGTLGYSDWIALSLGIEHNSGHISDEILNNLAKKDDSDINKFITKVDGWEVSDYIRENPLVLNISVKPIEYLRVYFGMRLPGEMDTLEPAFHDPMYWQSRETKDAMNYDWYKNWHLQTGLELTLPIPYVGNFFVAADIQFDQSGQVVLEPTGNYYKTVPTYEPVLKKDAPWRVEYSIVFGQYLSQPTDPIQIRIEFAYRNGRVPAFNYLEEKNSQIISFGVVLGR